MRRGLIDIDNVVSEWLRWVMEQQDEIPKLAGLRSGRLSEMWDLTEEEVDQIVQDIRGYTEVALVPGALNGLWLFYMDPTIEFTYLSAAPVEARSGRYQWMQEQSLPDVGIDQVIHVGTSEEKTAHILELGEDYDFIIDDFLSALDTGLLAGIETRIIFDRPWNSEDEENHIRVQSWAEIVSVVQQIQE